MWWYLPPSHGWLHVKTCPSRIQSRFDGISALLGAASWVREGRRRRGRESKREGMYACTAMHNKTRYEGGRGGMGEEEV